MAPGYLHCDVRRGLRVDVLNAAIASLLVDHAPVKKALDSLEIDGLTYVLVEHHEASLNGHQIHLYRHGQQITTHHDHAIAEDIFAKSVSLEKITAWLSTKPLSPSIGGLVDRVLQILRARVYQEQNIAGDDALWLVCHVVLFCALIDALDPKFITTTKICVSDKFAPSTKKNTLVFTDTRWLNHVMIGVPMIEINDDVSVDVIGIACIKALAGHVGARGESRILKVGVGLAHGAAALAPVAVEVLWCEPRLPESMTEHGASNCARLTSVYEIAGVLSAQTDIAHIASMMSLHGAMSLSWHLAQREKNLSCYVMRFLITNEDKRDAIEAFLIKGGAYDVTVSVVERHELAKRIVSVPIGTGNKATSARFYEYLYLDKTVRVEPVKEDLDLYVKRTDYSVDVARSDLLLAWKKWRGRVVSEDA